MKEKLQNLPSSFVFIEDGVERRLKTNEQIALDLEIKEEKNSLKSISVSVISEQKLKFELRFKNDVFVLPEWGMLKKQFHSNEREFGISLTSGALHENDNSHEIIGSNLSFDHNFTKLNGSGWTIEYKPS